MRIVTTASIAAFLFSLIPGLVVRYLDLLGGTGPGAGLPSPLLGLATLVSFVAQYPAPIIFFFWLGMKTTRSGHLGTLSLGVLVGSYIGRLLGLLLPGIAGGSTAVNAAIAFDLMPSVQMFFVSVGTYAISCLRKSWRSRVTLPQPD